MYTIYIVFMNTHLPAIIICLIATLSLLTIVIKQCRAFDSRYYEFCLRRDISNSVRCGQIRCKHVLRRLSGLLKAIFRIMQACKIGLHITYKYPSGHLQRGGLSSPSQVPLASLWITCIERNYRPYN
jgi:hypothetical protein